MNVGAEHGLSSISVISTDKHTSTADTVTTGL